MFTVQVETSDTRIWLELTNNVYNLFFISKESKYDRSWFQRLHFGYCNQSLLKHDRSIILGLQTGNQNTPDRKTSSLLILKIIQVTVKDAYCEPQ